jgi:hypothetical protein
LLVSQTEFGALHVLSVAVHPTQKPSGSLHTGVAPEHCELLEQPAVHLSDWTSQIPSGALHCALPVHWTQMFLLSSQMGVADPATHATESAAVHWTQPPALVPLFAHAGLSVE